VANRVYRTTGEGIPTHPYRRLEAVSVELEPEEVKFEIERLELRYGIRGDDTKSNQAILRSADLRVLSLTYEQITGGMAEATMLDAKTAERIWAFLGVDPTPLPRVKLRRAHHRPWASYVSNWDVVREAIATMVNLEAFPATRDGGEQES